MKLINLITIFLSLFVVSSLDNPKTVEQKAFYETIHENYQYYYLLNDTTYQDHFDITIVLGMIDQNYYLSLFVYEEALFRLRSTVIINDRTITPASINHVSQLNRILVYQTDQITIEVGSNSLDAPLKYYEFVLPETLDQFYEIASVGNGLDQFPENILELDFKSIMIFAMVIAFGFILILITIIGDNLCKKYLKTDITAEINKLEQLRNNFYNQYGNNHQTPYYNHYNQNYQQPNNYQPVSSNVSDDQNPNLTKQERMDFLFKKYQNGEINQNQLNEALKELWWRKDD